MDSRSIETKTITAAKWSIITQVASKLITPLTQLVLAHVLTPEIFGIIALVTMVTSFADMFSDAGFQKYLIQHEYDKDDAGVAHYHLSANVAFWTNLTVSFVLWGVIVVFRDGIALILGDGSIGLAIAVASASLPLTSAISVQTAIYQRKFDFKTLFYSRVLSALSVFLISVPLALAGFGYWSMIAGAVLSNLFLAIWLTVKSDWRPSFQFSFDELRNMLSFSVWTLVEAFSIWVTNWAGAFILGTLMSSYYLGLYNTSVSLVNSIVAIVSGAINPVVFASLSRLQLERNKFEAAFYSMQKYLGFAVIPIAVALAVFSDSAIGILLGDQWIEASMLFGLYSLSSAFVVVFGHILSDVYRALGKPRLSLLAQVLFLVFYIPSLIAGASLGFEALSLIVPIARIAGSLFPHAIISKFAIGLSPVRMMFNLRWVYLASAVTGVPCCVGIMLLNLGTFWQIVLLVLSVLLYLIVVLLIKDLRKTLIGLLGRFGLASILVKLLPDSVVQRWNVCD